MIKVDPKTLKPTIYCDQCGKPITSRQDGDVLTPDGTDEVYYAHKGKCSYGLEATFKNPPYTKSQELLSFMKGLDNSL